jgi:hypothetical protein
MSTQIKTSIDSPALAAHVRIEWAGGTANSIAVLAAGTEIAILGASNIAINVHEAVVEVELCLAPDPISEEAGSGQDSAVDSGFEAGVSPICGLGASCGGEEEKEEGSGEEIGGLHFGGLVLGVALKCLFLLSGF